MICLDTNIYIYIANGKLSPSTIKNHDIAFASVSKIEALGFHELVAQEQSRLKIIFEAAEQIQLTDDVVAKAIHLRQNRKMSLGDAIVASSALENKLELWTANTKDFEHIEDLKLHNPMQGLL